MKVGSRGKLNFVFCCHCSCWYFYHLPFATQNVSSHSFQYILSHSLYLFRCLHFIAEATKVMKCFVLRIAAIASDMCAALVTHTQTQASLCFQFVLFCSLGMNASRETNIKSGGNWFKATVTKVTNGDTISSSCVKANKTHRNKNNYWNCRWWRFRRDKYNEKKKADTFSRSTRFSPPSNQTSCTCLRFLHIHTFIGGRLLAQNQQQNYKSQQKTQHRHWRNNSFNIIEKSVCLCVCVNSLNPETHREGRRKSFCVLAKFRLSGVIYWKTYECRSHPSTTVRGEFITNNRFSIQRSGRSEKKNDDHKEWEQKNRHIKLISVICVDILLTVCSVKWNRIVGSIETSADGYERFPYNFQSKILKRF